VTLLVGFWLSFLSEVLRDRRLVRREAHARRMEYERTTLTGLQDALNDLMRTYGKLHMIRARAQAARTAWNKVTIGKELDERMRIAERNAATLASRTRDDEVRGGIEEIKKKGNQMILSPSYDRAEEAFLDSIILADKLVRRMGELIRESLTY
jgi:hypothetical protein